MYVNNLFMARVCACECSCAHTKEFTHEHPSILPTRCASAHAAAVAARGVATRPVAGRVLDGLTVPARLVQEAGVGARQAGPLPDGEGGVRVGGSWPRRKAWGSPGDSISEPWAVTSPGKWPQQTCHVRKGLYPVSGHIANILALSPKFMDVSVDFAQAWHVHVEMP